ncbi:MAG: PDZ domain-containing protein [Planctomycetaceae bacterium]|nr:PDZ domain-containing protein [Planctomycetaceae bacterium]
MNRWSTAVVGASLFLAGIAIGSRGDLWHWHLWQWQGAVNAQGPRPSASDSTYSELQAGGTPLQRSSELLARIARLTTNSVVHIESERRTDRGRLVEETGSGVIIESPKAEGLFVVSNRHVVDKAQLDNISIHLHDGRVIHPVKIWTDQATDVAVLKVVPTNLQAARWGDSEKIEIGNLVLALGSPFGLSQSVTMGIISAKGRRSLKLGETSDMLNQDFLQTDAAINPGNSGGPLIDMQGQVIGINTAIASNSGGNEGIGFSIPSNLVRHVAEQLIEHGKVTRAYLGVKLDPEFSVEVAARLKLDRIRGARVLEVYPDTPASRSNLKFDDVILTFNGIEVLDENHLINLVSLTDVDKSVKVVVFREGRHMTIDVKVGDRAKLEQRAEAPAVPGMGTRVDSLGLMLHPLEPAIAVQLGYAATDKGLLVLRVDHNGPMDGDLHLYDLIEEVARTPVGSVADLESALATSGEGDSVLLTVKRREHGQMQSEAVVYHR